MPQHTYKMLIHTCTLMWWHFQCFQYKHTHTWCSEWCLNGNRKKDFAIHFDGMDDNDCHRYMIFAMSFRRRNFSLSLVFPVISFQAPSVFLSPHTHIARFNFVFSCFAQCCAHCNPEQNENVIYEPYHTLLLLLIKLRCFRCGFYNFF